MGFIAILEYDSFSTVTWHHCSRCQSCDCWKLQGLLKPSKQKASSFQCPVFLSMNITKTFRSSTCSSAELRLFHQSHSLWFFTLNFQNSPLCLSGVNCSVFFNGRIRISWFGACTDLAPSQRAASSGQPSPQIGWGPDPSHCWPSGPSWCSWQCGYLRWLLPGSAQHHPSQPPSLHLWLLPPTGTSYPQCLTPPEGMNKKMSADGVFLCGSYSIGNLWQQDEEIKLHLRGIIKVNNLIYKFYCNMQRKCKEKIITTKRIKSKVAFFPSLVHCRNMHQVWPYLQVGEESGAFLPSYPVLSRHTHSLWPLKKIKSKTHLK